MQIIVAAVMGAALLMSFYFSELADWFISSKISEANVRRLSQEVASPLKLLGASYRTVSDKDDRYDILPAPIRSKLALALRSKEASLAILQETGMLDDDIEAFDDQNSGTLDRADFSPSPKPFNR